MNPSAVLSNIEKLLGPHQTIWLGYSGGLDSTVLLHILATSSFSARVSAVHVNHGLSPNADLWAKECKSTCEALHLPLTVLSVVVENKGKGLENAARDERYKAFSSVLDESSILLLAHHQNDQAETLLFRLARGTGIRGLAGISAHRKFGAAKLLRPLLSYSRKQLLAYAEKHGLSWVEDESNTSDKFDRNFIRNKVVPIFELRWPRFTEQVANAAERVSAHQRLLDDYLASDLVVLGRKAERVGESLDLTAFCRQSTEKQYALLQRWCELFGCAHPNQIHLNLVGDVLHAKEDAKPCLSWGNAELRRFNGRLYLLPKLDLSPFKKQKWNPQFSLSLGGIAKIECLKLGGLNLDEPFEIKVRTNSERCRPVGRNHSQTVKKLLQEYRLEPWLRGLVPCVYYKGELVAVGDLWECDTGAREEDMCLRWQFCIEKKS